MKLLTVKNRCDTAFTGMYDGVSYTVPAGEQVILLADVARHLRGQSVFLDNPITGEKEYRLAVLEDGDVAVPIREETLPIESFNRIDMDLSKVRILKTNARPAAPLHKDVAGQAITAKERDS